MKKSLFVLVFAIFASVFTADSVLAQTGAASDSGKAKSHAKATNTIAEVAMSNSNFTTLVTAVKAANLADTLMSAGPFTVFAPTNDAFAKLPAGTVDNLVKAENQAALAGVLKYHVVSGNVSAKDLLKLIKKGNGSAILTTVQGDKLTAKTDGKMVMLTDAKGSTVNVIMADVKASNGVIHAIDNVLMPSM
jgi:uncharacterized surface protein with fasciclin (FAS1) repeats